jgi:hypothetical protein
MKAQYALGLSAVLTLTTALVMTPQPASACAPALIVWEPATHTQHFIRRASFRTSADDFGFLVPTPTKPTLAEASDEVFPMLAKITAPEVVEKPRPSNPGCGIGCSKSAPYPGMAASKVEVLEEKHVAGYKAAVLAASDADGLATWLKDHGYDFSPELVDWAGVYSKEGWIVTAFKVEKAEPNAARAATSAVRMTFTTDRPFFPYREPVQKPGTSPTSQDRMLRIFFLGEERMQGTFGDKTTPWGGKTVWANPITAADRDNVIKALRLPENAGSMVTWLTEFEDSSSPRPAAGDLYFSRSPKQDAVVREPWVRFVSAAPPDNVMGFALPAVLFLPLLLRQYRRNSR